MLRRPDPPLLLREGVATPYYMESAIDKVVLETFEEGREAIAAFCGNDVFVYIATDWVRKIVLLRPIKRTARERVLRALRKLGTALRMRV